MSTIKKGTEVYLINDYDHKAAVIVRRMTVKSFGKVRGTASHMEGGKMLETFIDPKMIGQTIFVVADVADINVFALEMAKTQKARRIAHYRDTQQWYLDANTQYHASMKRDCEAVIAATPSVIFHQQ